MTDRPLLNEMNEWKKLEKHYESIKSLHLRELFENDARADEMSFEAADLYLDYSKNRVTSETMDLLFGLAEACGLKQSIDDMFSGKPINETENRSVLHTALRNRSGNPVMVDGEDVMPDVNAVLEKMAAFAERVRSGEWVGYTGKKIRNIVNIGIGGSDLGPATSHEGTESYPSLFHTSRPPGLRRRTSSGLSFAHIHVTPAWCPFCTARGWSASRHR
ncbi:hypothetical protein BVX94_00355, partial [bacterium B17]